MGGSIVSGFFERQKSLYLKNIYLATPTPKIVYQATLKSLPDITAKNFVKFSQNYTRKAKTSFESGGHILTHLNALVPTAAVAMNICNAYYIQDAAELILANQKTINILINIASAAFENNNTPDKKITLVSNFVAAICKGVDHQKAFRESFILAGNQPQKYVSDVYLQEKKNKNKKRGKNNNYNNNKGFNYYNNNNNQSGQGYSNNNNGPPKTEPVTQHLDKNLSLPKQKNIQPRTHMCYPSSCKEIGCSNNKN